MWPFNTGDCLKEVTAWAGFTVFSNVMNTKLHAIKTGENVDQYSKWY